MKEQSFLGIDFPKDYTYPMPRIPPSLLDQRIGDALAKLTDDETKFLEMDKPVTEVKVRSLPAARNSQPYRNRRACAGNTNCIPICPIQAKYDPTITLNEATDRGAILIDHAVASEIIVEDGRVSQINFIRYKDEAGPKTGEGCVKAKIYVIAANAIETPRLLLMSKNQGRTGKGVANSSDMVGRHLMDHPYYVAWALLPPTAKPVFPYRGPLITSGIGDLCDGPFRAKRAAFRVDIGNEGWNFVVAGGAVRRRSPRDDHRFRQWDELERPQYAAIQPARQGQRGAVRRRPGPQAERSDYAAVPDRIPGRAGSGSE